MNLRQLFDFSLEGRRNEPALEFLACDGRLESRAFGDLDAASNRLARVLAERGYTAGDRLCVHLPNSVEMIELFLACVKLGVIFVPINILYREREIAHIVSDAEPKAMFTTRDLELLARDAMTAGPPERTLFLPLDGDAPAAIVYTSGTTGASKGAVLTHNNFAANALNLITCWQITSADRLLLPLPLFHVHGLGNGLCTWLITGCRLR
jgi:malonyl-CoA/methylmalonyl-CoA synthetase